MSCASRKSWSPSASPRPTSCSASRSISGYEKRQILSGIAEHYTPEELIGRRIVVITNLAPRKMRGLESHGMLLAASYGENGKPYLATFAESDDIPLGSRLK